jgi:hypothetical protein
MLNAEYFHLQMDRVRSMIVKAKNEWIQNPEHLENCSIGLNFPVESEDTKETKFIKLVQFYRVEEEDPDYPSQIEKCFRYSTV